MVENDLKNVGDKKPIFMIKNIVRVFAVLGIIFVFCPSFLVSCSGQEVDVNVMTAVGGVSVYGEKVVDPHPVMLICLLIPAAVLALTVIKKFTEKKTAVIILACAAVDFVIWLIFRASVKKVADENYCDFKTTGWYVVNMIVLLLTMVTALLIFLQKISMDTDLKAFVAGGGHQDALNQMSAAVSQMSSAVTNLAGNAISGKRTKDASENTIGFCAKCGSKIEYGCKFCMSCGTPVPESMIAEAEAAKKAAEEAAKKAAEENARLEAESVGNAQAVQADKPMFCQSCGAKLEEDALFCKACGSKIV